MKHARFGIAVITTLTLGGGALCAHAQASDKPFVRARTLSEDLLLFSQVLNQIRVNHPDSADSHELLMAAIEGLVRATDPHSFVVPAVRLDSARQRAWEEGKLARVPISFVYAGRTPIVVSVAPGSQAARHDILVGDELVAVEGRPLAAESEEELDIALAGARGSAVSLRFMRRRLDGTSAVVDRAIKRERVEDLPAVPIARMLDSVTGYVRVTTFASEKVADDMHAAVERLEKSGMRRLLIDLRDNGGGLVAQASDAVGEFLPKGAVIYTAEGRKQSVNKTVKVSRSFFRRERGYPVVLLVNRGTASASELFAGALQDHDRAIVVGRPTFGKALLMQGMPLTDGSYMMLVIGHVKTPCGRIIQRQYRGVRQSDYYRGADAARDTTGRPSCRTPAGRTLYGGGGIYPDVVLDEPDPVPLWLRRLQEQELPLKWAGAVSADAARAPADVERYVSGEAIPPSAVAEFREFTRARGGQVPDDPDADARLRRVLAAELARAKFGDAGYFRVVLSDDAWIQRAMQAFDRAALLTGSRP